MKKTFAMTIFILLSYCFCTQVSYNYYCSSYSYLFTKFVILLLIILYTLIVVILIQHKINVNNSEIEVHSHGTCLCLSGPVPECRDSQWAHPGSWAASSPGCPTADTWVLAQAEESSLKACSRCHAKTWPLLQSPCTSLCMNNYNVYFERDIFPEILTSNQSSSYG